MIASNYGIGVVSKNTVDACIDFVNKTGNDLTLIPSRRQVDNFGGYVENWTTKEFSNYVRSKTNNIFLKRDHGGPNQGNRKDNGLASLLTDCTYFDAIHIDPWKFSETFNKGVELTAFLIDFCYSNNPHIRFEIGTEESICKYTDNDLDYLLNYLDCKLYKGAFSNINFAVIQSGTSLKENKNTGTYDKDRLTSMIEICKLYRVLSKEHNGDYLSSTFIKEKFDLGLNAINIAPEIGQIETQTYLNEIKNTPLFDIYYEICYLSKRWVKWVDKDFVPEENKEKLINICGHYVLSHPYFISQIKRKVRSDIDDCIKYNITNKLEELYEVINTIS